jgi:hypothetical protein
MRGPISARWLPAVLVALVLPLGATGCVENDQSVIITGSFALDDEDCTVPTSGGTGRARGVFDIGLASSLNDGYIMAVRVQNQLPPTAMGGMMGMMGGQGAMPVEMNHIQLVGFEVDLIPDPDQPITAQLPAGVPGVTRLTIPYAGGLITAGGGTVTGPIEVFNSNAASILLSSRAVKGGASTVGEPYQTVTVRLRARTLRSGSIINSSWFEFPISICAFCLARKAGEPGISGYNPGSGSLFECPEAMMLEEAGLISSCLPQQDSSSTCCLKDRQILCGLTIPHKAMSEM